MKLSSVNSNQTPAVFMPEKSAGANADIQALEKKLQQLQQEKQKAVQQERQKQVSGKPDEQGEQPIIMKTTGNTDQVDREIENLKQTKTQMEQKIAAAKDEREKQVLKTRLEQVKAELRMKDNDTYRRQHMQITEQKVVSKIGE